MEKILEFIINKDSGERLRKSFTFEKIYFENIIKNPKSLKEKEDLLLIKDLLNIYPKLCSTNKEIRIIPSKVLL